MCFWKKSRLVYGVILSRAGTKSSQGDDFQVAVVINWLIRLLSDDSLAYIQAESNGISGFSEKVTVDDIVIGYADGHRRYIQAKKNQSTNRAWSFADLGDELVKSKEQLHSDPTGLVDFYSATPFGDFESLAAACREYPDFSAFQREVGKSQNDSLSTLAGRWCESLEHSFELAQRIRFGVHLDHEAWTRLNLLELTRVVTKPETAMIILESFTNAHQSKRSGTSFEVRRNQVFAELRKHGVVSAPSYEIQEVLGKFAEISRIGRDWNRSVGGQQFCRPEIEEVFQGIRDKQETILIVDRPGSGKTCLLLDIVDHLESDESSVLLFLKGDRFIGDESREILPDDIAEMCARLAEVKPLVVIIDSLDVISLNRDSNSLNYFLNLIDRLQGITNITLIAACRTFDLQYDAKLRDRNWKKKIELADFDFNEVVVPLLLEWGVNVAALNMELERLLCLPQNLRLFEPIANLDHDVEIRSAYELQAVFLEECVRKNPDIGSSGLGSLQQFANQLLKARVHQLPSVQFSGDESIRRSLISQNVLFEDSGKITFSHQTLFDALVVQHALANDEGLLSFILSHPPFPFLRASVQTFLFHLRTHSHELFSRQITQVLGSSGVAYHLKRLIVETIGTLKVDPTNDWPLVRRIYQNHTALFERLFWKTTGDGWFKLLHDQWFPLLNSADQNWRRNFLHRLGQWANDFPSEVNNLRVQAIKDHWGDENAVYTIIWQLDQFTEWQNERIYPLLELISRELINHQEIDRQNDFLNVMSKYIAVTNHGYELLWQFMTRNVTNKEVLRFELDGQLDCDFQDKVFLQQSLEKSSHFLDLVLKDLEIWAYREELRDRPLNTAFLHNCPSYNHRHGQSDYSADLGALLKAIEAALYSHAKAGSSWWQANEPQLRTSNLVIILYFLIKPYSEFSERHVNGICALLTNSNLLRYGHLEHELGQLMQAIYYFLPEDIQLQNQRYILNLYHDEVWQEQHGYIDELPQWVCRKRYNYLLWIPLVYRTQESQLFVEYYEQDFGRFLPEPSVNSWGGTVGYPLTLAQMQGFSDKALIDYCKHYEGYNDGFGSHPGDRLRGDQGMVQRRLSEATAYDPERYLKLIPLFIASGLDTGYSQNIVHGVADHIRYRFGNVRSSSGQFEWKQPEVDGEWLAEQLLNLLESADWLWTDTRQFNLFVIPEACCDVLTNKKHIGRLVFLLFQLLFELRREQVNLNPKKSSDDISNRDLRFHAINSDWGHVGRGISKLCNRLLGAEAEVPELLYPLLRHLIKISKQAAITIIDAIPYITYKKPEWGFQLFSDIYDSAEPVCPWGWAQRHLYYQYNDNFKYTAPYLAKMLQSGETEAIQSWGLLSTMSHLAGHLTQDQLFENLIDINREEAWIAAAQVFEGNLDKHTRDGMCINGMVRILELELDMPRVISEIEDAFDPKKRGGFVRGEFARIFIEKASIHGQRRSIRFLLDWLADLSSRDPLSSLELLELLADKLSAESARRLYDGKSLIQALNALLREADETDEEQLISRVISLQDRFLQLDLHGIEDFFNAAGRS